MIKVLKKFKSNFRLYKYCAQYRKDDYKQIDKFYQYISVIHSKELKMRKEYVDSQFEEETNQLQKDGFKIINFENMDLSNEFYESLNLLKEKYNQINWEINAQVAESSLKTKIDFLRQQEVELNHHIINVVSPFIQIITNYLKYLPIMLNSSFWYSPNKSKQLRSSQLFHLDPDDYKNVKIFIPIDEIDESSGPLNIIPAENSIKIYNEALKKGIIKKRGNKITDQEIQKFMDYNPKKILLKKNQIAMIDTCNCYHFGSRESNKPRKLIFFHFTPPFSAKTPIFRKLISNEFIKNFKDQLIYSYLKNHTNHYSKKSYLKF